MMRGYVPAGPTRRRRRHARLHAPATAVAAAATAAFFTLPTRAASDSWTLVTSGNWNVAGNWSAGIPTNTADVFITNAGSKLVTYINPSTNNSFLSLTLDSTAFSVNTLGQTQDSITVATETIGGTGRAAYSQTGGTNTVTSSLIIGNVIGSTGTYGLVAGALVCSGTALIGASGTGRFVQAGGAVNASAAQVFIGSSGNAVGLYSLSAGSLTSGTVTLGHLNSANGIFNQSGGTHLISGTLTLGDATATAIGAYNMSNGATLIVTNRAIFGSNGTGAFLQTGGSSTFKSLVTLATNFSSVGLVTLSGGSMQSAAEIIGGDGTATFNHSGGTHSVSGTFIVAAGTLGHGAYNMSNGAVLTVGGLATIGQNNPGTFLQTGGSSTFNGGLTVGSFDSGTVTLSGGTLTLPISGAGETIGATFGTGATFNHSGGTHTIAGSLTIGASSPGQYAMSNGATLNVSGITQIGSALNSGTFTQSGGFANFQSNLMLPRGSISLSGGTFTTGTNNAVIGSGGTAAAVVSQSGGTLTAGFLVLSNGGFPRYDQSGGTLQAGTEIIDIGNFNQSGGVNLTNPLILGSAAGGAGGAYSMSNGATLHADSISVGGSTNGSFLQTGGVTKIDSSLIVGNAAAAAGTATLAGGSLTVSSSTTVGNRGKATFIQNGGAHVINLPGGNPGLILGAATASAGSYFLNAGLLSVPNAAENIGALGAGFYSQSDGTNNCFAMSIGDAVTGTNFSSGTVTLSGGTLNPVNALSVGNFGVGNLNHVDGNLNTTILYVGGFNTNAVSTYSMTNGTLAVSTLSYVGYHGIGAFNQSGGSATLGSALYIDFGQGGSGTVNLSGGFLTAGSTINNGTYIQSGGSFATLGAVSGSGSMTIGNNSGTTARANVTRFDQTSITIKSTGTLAVATNATRFTNSVANLQILGNGTLDLGNHELLTSTDPATIKVYLANAFDAAGNQDWGKPGLTSSIARANPNTFSVGYAFGGDQSAQDAAITTHDGTPLDPFSTLVRPVLTGDANLDGTVDFFDIAQVLGYRYNTGQASSYTDGDLNYDGVVDFFDLTVILSSNYNTGQHFGPAAETASALAHNGREAAVPEPTALGLLTLASASLLKRKDGRRRRGARVPR
jgi:hypothetical protein